MCNETYYVGSGSTCANTKPEFKVELIAIQSLILVGVQESRRLVVLSNATVTCIEADQESSTASTGILSDLF